MPVYRAYLRTGHVVKIEADSYNHHHGTFHRKVKDGEKQTNEEIANFGRGEIVGWVLEEAVVGDDQ